MQVFLGTKYTKWNKDHTCHTCSHNIPKGTTVRHDVWKEGKTVKNKYLCKDCDILHDHFQYNYWNLGHHNPQENEYKTKFPHLFTSHFRRKYAIRKRINVVAEIQRVFIHGTTGQIIYRVLHKMLGLKTFGAYKFIFDASDYLDYKRTHKEARHTSVYMLSIIDTEE